MEIKKIIHISDLHIRTYTYHDIYQNIFENFIEELKVELLEYQHEEVRIVITGDLVHQKISVSNELTMMCSWLLTELSLLGKVIIIPGNHDFLENNIDRLDTITPIVQTLKNDNIIYYRDFGVYKDNNVNWVVYSLFQHNTKPEFVVDDNELYIGLFHGPIEGMETDLGFKFSSGYSRLNFVGCDVVLCGDIHKRQRFEIPGGGFGIMIGSFIQQNYGESIDNHGYGILDVNTLNYVYKDMENPQPFLHFKITDINDIEDDKETLLNVG